MGNKNKKPMSKKKKIILITILILACLLLLVSHFKKSNRLARLNREHCSSLKLDMSREDVLGVMGSSPYFASIATENDNHSISYDYESGFGESEMISIQFGNDDKVVYVVCGDAGYIGHGQLFDFDISQVGSVQTRLTVQKGGLTTKVEIYKFYENSRTNIHYTFSNDGTLTDVYVIEIKYPETIHPGLLATESTKKLNIDSSTSTREDYSSSNNTLKNLDDSVKQEGYDLKDRLYSRLSF
jgi:hypothetical protein